MLIIRDSDFEMVQVKEIPFFNLSMLTPVNSGKENERMKMKLVAYGLPFEACLKQIVHMKMLNKEGECTVAEYIKLYKETVNYILSLVVVEETLGKDPVEVEEDESIENCSGDQ